MAKRSQNNGKPSSNGKRSRRKARCTATTKAGKPCKSPPIKDTDRCLSHSPKAKRANASFGGSENGRKGGEAKRVPRLTELLRAEVEERAEEIITKLFKGLTAERALVVGTGPKARLELAPDPDLALKTIREIFDRAEGRPMQRTESKVETRSADQLDREIDRLLAEVERLTEALAKEHLSGSRNGARA